VSQAPEGQPRSQRLSNAGQAEQQRPSAQQSLGSASLTCSSGEHASQLQGTQPPVLPPRPHFHHVGLGFELQAYRIGARQRSLQLPARSHGAAKTAQNFIDAKGSKLPLAANPQTHHPKQLTPPGAGDLDPFTGLLTSGAGKLKVEPTVMGYTRVGAAEGQLNDLLGRSIAVHLQRSGILKPSGSGNFKGSMLGKPEAGLNNTEMLALRIYTYVQAMVDGQEAIYAVLDGKLDKVVTRAFYDDRKLAVPNVYADSLCGAMPLIPGVYQVVVLLRDATLDQPGNGGFMLVEVHCDGDPLYP
jgi:hypothetical protein